MKVPGLERLGLEPWDAVRWLVAIAALMIGPRLGVAWHPGRLSYDPEVGVMLAVLFATSRIPREGALRAVVPVAAVSWTALVVFETALAIGHFATNEYIPLYDEALLARHLYNLGHDLYGTLVTAVVAGVVVSPVPIALVGAALFGEVDRVYRKVPIRAGALLAAIPLLVGAVDGFLPWEHWSLPMIAANLGESWTLYSGVTSQLETRTHQDLNAIHLQQRPDVIVYTVESYGRVMATDPAFAEEWVPLVQDLDQKLTAAGWHTASGWDESPVHGGRSWIADQSLLLGIHVSHEAEYQHVIGWTDRLPSLRKFMDDQGYTTVLVRPTDIDRPGVKLGDPYGFDRTAFHADLGYNGPIIGWGQIPDQYAIDWAQEQILDQIDGPRFAFFHLATSHLPWSPAPEIYQSYQDLQTAEGSREPLYETRTVQSQLDMEFTRYKRKLPPGKTRNLETQHANYLADVLYDLECVGKRLKDGPQRPSLIIVMGDHQPPLLAEDEGDEVPVHLLASDPALLEVLEELGFNPGLLPTGEHAVVAHEDLFDVIAKSLARADERMAPAPDPGP